MIFLSQERIAQMIFLSFVYGILFGMIMDVIRLFRLVLLPEKCHGRVRRLRRAAVIVFNFATDLLFVFGFASCAVIFTYNMSGGVFRGVVYVMMAAGLVIYSLTVCRITVKLNTWISGKIKFVLRKIFYFISVPLHKIKKHLIKIYTLTISEKIGRINRGIREKKDRVEKAVPEALVPQKEYKKEGRISLGRKRPN